MKHARTVIGTIGYAFLLAATAFPTNAQQTTANPGVEAFASENAILDTTIPFAIGAREAQQSLRGSFGWPTFQEGLVEGVYFRFDPDGYARFAPTPRLDTDVFEVICRPRTYSCMARKSSVSIILNSRGQLQIKIDDVQAGDRFFVSEGVSEIEVPERILQPLDTQLEILLSTGGDLIIRRGDKEKDRISLTGFYPVAAYLRWVTARQDYTILPRGWPVPNSVKPDAGMTQSKNWQSPMPQPQNFPVSPAGYTPSQTSGSSLQVIPESGQQLPVNQSAQNQVAEVKGELKLLRELLLQREQASASNSPQPENPKDNPLTTASLMPTSESVAKNEVNSRIASLQETANKIQEELAKLAAPQNQQLPPAHPSKAEEGLNPLSSTPPNKGSVSDLATQLQYLMGEIGLDAQTSMMLIQLSNSKSQIQKQQPLTDFSFDPSSAAVINSQSREKPQAYQETVVSQILRELEKDAYPDLKPTEQKAPEQVMPDQDFQLLSSYFKSLAMPTLREP